jgi:hypothetical protein
MPPTLTLVDPTTEPLLSGRFTPSYNPSGAVTVESRPRGVTVRVGGGTCTLTPRAFRPSEYSVAA